MRFAIAALGLMAVAMFASAAGAADMYGKGVAPITARVNSGVYIGGFAGTDMHSVDEGSSVSVGLDGYKLTGRIGYDHCIASTCSFVLGAFGDIGYSNAKTTGGDIDVTAAWSYDLGVRAGIPLGGTLLYATGGFEWDNFDIKSGSYDPSGPFAGAGVQFDLGNKWAGTIELRRAWVDQTNINDTRDSVMAGFVRFF
jgi:hypothetical protein